ncbi:hypothetical protein DL765_011103 [Monosporascus sp. GIB2]|nr:hypothetical protein DL765_011103 [Monosporascus sp. GIB2]
MRANARSSRRYANKHGTVVRITPTILSVSDATKIPVIYHRFADKSSTTSPAASARRRASSTCRTTERIRATERIAAARYSFSNIKRMEPLVDENITRMAREARRMVRSDGRALRLHSLGHLRGQGRDVDGLIRGSTVASCGSASWRASTPFTNWIKSMWVGEKYLVASPQQGSGIGVLMRFRDRLVAQRYKGIEAGTTDGRIDFLQTDAVYEKMMAEIDAAAGRKCSRSCRSTRRSWSIARITSHAWANHATLPISPEHLPPAGFERRPGPTRLVRAQGFGGDAQRVDRAAGPGHLRARRRWVPARAQARRPREGQGIPGAQSRSATARAGASGKDLAQMELFKTSLQFFRAFTPRAANPKVPGRYRYKGGIVPLPTYGSP